MPNLCRRDKEVSQSSPQIVSVDTKRRNFNASGRRHALVFIEISDYQARLESQTADFDAPATQRRRRLTGTTEWIKR